MAYTVTQLAKLSGVSIRTLHFYDEIRLLKPAHIGENRYRYYEEEQLLVLQQILFFRELGFELKRIQEILARKDFDRVSALRDHRKVLLQERKRIGTLIETLDKTIEHEKGERKMKNKELFSGFAPEKQKEYENYLKNRLGENHPTLSEAKNNTQNWSKADWTKSGAEWEGIMKDLALALKRGSKPDGADVQAVVERHCRWLRKYWTPKRESYIGLGMGYAGFEWKKAFEPYDPHHPKLALFLAEAMRNYAERELS